MRFCREYAELKQGAQAIEDARRDLDARRNAGKNIMTIKKLTLGNSNAGYDTCLVEISTSGKAKLVDGTINGRSSVIKKCVANYNRGQNYYLTTAGDQLPFVINLLGEENHE